MDGATIMEIVKVVVPCIAGVVSGVAGYRFRLSKLEVENQELQKRVKELEAKHDTLRDSSNDFAMDADLAHFMQQQENSWQQIQRTLGQIEGYLMLGKDHQPLSRPVTPHSFTPRRPPPPPLPPRPRARSKPDLG